MNTLIEALRWELTALLAAAFVLVIVKWLAWEQRQKERRSHPEPGPNAPAGDSEQ